MCLFVCIIHAFTQNIVTVVPKGAYSYIWYNKNCSSKLLDEGVCFGLKVTYPGSGAENRR